MQQTYLQRFNELCALAHPLSAYQQETEAMRIQVMKNRAARGADPMPQVPECLPVPH